MRLITTMLGLILAGCSPSEDSYALYRTSSVDGVSRFHVFTFDASGGDGYNMSNCQLAAERWQKQHGVDAKFWCEKGPFKK